MDEISTAEKVLDLVDMLTTEVDNYMQEHEALLEAFLDLQKRNDELCDVIAVLVGERDKLRGHRDN